MYAVIRSGGKQYRVSPGDVLNLEKLPTAKGEAVEWREVLAVSNDQGRVLAGAGVVVTGTVVAQAKAAKVLVFHYKRKKQYKKLQGHRQQFTRVRVDGIQLPA
ncbi:MAG TPA: 50S ribosomal protein L21 [Terriglobales bacterium]|nr:50S ribosomal protein L21 [Terriglobales bacterium]